MTNIETPMDVMVDLISSLTPLTAWRSNEDRLIEEDEDVNSYIVVSLLPTGKKNLLSINNFIGLRDNPLYKNFGYIEVYSVIYRVITPTRAQSREYARTIENYLKVNFNSISIDIVLRRHSFSSQKVFTISTVERLYGVETSFEITYANVWDDEPETGALSQTPVDIIEVNEINEKSIKIRVSYE